MDADAVNAGLVAGGAPGNAAAEHADGNAPDAPEVNVDDADVGILGADASSSEDEDEEDAPTDLHDVWEALNHATLTGSFAASDIADGSTLTPALPNPGLKLNGVGGIPLPLSDWHAKAIKSNRHTTKIQDGSYHQVHSVEPRRLHINNPAWEGKFASLLQTVAYRLGVDPDKLSAKLDMLLLMEKGSHVKRCSNAEEGDGVIGTLLVQLPSTFKGGKVTVYNVDGDEEEDDGHGEDEEGDEHGGWDGGEEGDEHGGGEEEEEHGEDDEEYEDEDEVKTFNIGASGEGSFSCHFLCHYNDCEFEIDKVVSGHRALLRYSLRYEGESETPSANALVSSMSALKWSLTALPPSERILMIPMAKQYKTVDLGRHGINALSHWHRSRFEAIKVSAGDDWRVLLVKAKQCHTHKVDDYYGRTLSSTRDFSVQQIFDEDGNDVTTAERWLKSAVKLTPLDVDNGMILNAEGAYKESWGRKCSSSTSTEGYYEDTKVTTKQFVATFILAYDATLVDAELQCLCGSSGVAKVTGKVVAARDYSMLDLVLAVVDSKEKAKFDVSSCTKVLQMLNRSRGKKALSSERVDFVRKTISGLGSSEPNAELYDAIRAAADKFGYENIIAQVSELLSNADRRKDLELHLFLLRCDFILKISNGGHENTLLETQCRALPRFGADKIEDSGVINSAIDGLMSEHGWEAVATVVEATLRFLHGKYSSSGGIPTLLDRARLLQKVSAHPNGFLRSCLVEFAKDFAKRLASSNAHTSTQQLSGDNKQIFVKAICYVMENGAEADFSNLGKWAIISQAFLPRVLEAIVEQAGALGFEAPSLIHEMLNRCLVQNSTNSNWYQHRRGDGTVPKSLHVRKVIADYPDTTRTPGRDGRLTLHCAVANKGTSFDTITDVFESYPQAASIRCPQSGIYPFMLAASKCPPPPRREAPAYLQHQVRADMDRCKAMIGASFRLLLANPSLVVGGIPADDEGSRKRKRRSASMDGQESEQA